MSHVDADQLSPIRAAVPGAVTVTWCDDVVVSNAPIEVAVIGAGAAGLSAALALQDVGADVVVLERSEVGSSWAGRHDGLRLNTVRWLSAMRGRPIPRREGRWLTRDSFVAYLRRVADEVVVRTGIEVTRIERDPSNDRWRIRTSDGDVDARVVVVTTGFDHTAVTPDWPGLGAWKGYRLHAAEYRTTDATPGRSVLVVGAGTSGLEIAVALANAGRTTMLSVRQVPTIFPRTWLTMPLTPLAHAMARLPDHVGDVLLRTSHRLIMGDLAPWGLRPTGRSVTRRLRETGHGLAVVDGLRHVLTSGALSTVATVTRFTPTSVVLADGTTVRPDTVIAATGYRRHLESLVGHLDVLDTAGRPVREPPGLYFIGYDLPISGQLPALPARAAQITTDATTHLARTAAIPRSEPET